MVGLVINKQSVHSFPDKRSKIIIIIIIIIKLFDLDPANIRYKMTFTIRDSADDYINVTCWGGESYVNILSQSFRIYDVGKPIITVNMPSVIQIQWKFKIVK